MIVVTGANGFIGSWMIRRLNQDNFNNIVAVDEFRTKAPHNYIKGLRVAKLIHRDVFLIWLQEHATSIEFVFHMGAISDTLETDESLFKKYNTEYSKSIWKVCASNQIPLIYASSAATYGNGENGFSDDHSLIPSLNPLNKYGESKQDFDLWALKQTEKPYFWAGIKFFNVYGPYEEHKGKMASMICQMTQQIKLNASVRLFKSNDLKINDGDQKRDFVYVEDVVEVMYWLMHHRRDSGVYNIGTGASRSFNEMVDILFSEINIARSVEYIDIPKSVEGKYQNNTQADIKKIKSIGYPRDFKNLEEGIASYFTLPTTF